MSIVYKIDVLAALKAAGYNTSKLRKDKIIGEAMIQKIRTHQLPSWAVLDTICELLDCQPADIIQYVKDEQGK